VRFPFAFCGVNERYGDLSTIMQTALKKSPKDMSTKTKNYGVIWKTTPSLFCSTRCPTLFGTLADYCAIWISNTTPAPYVPPVAVVPYKLPSGPNVIFASGWAPSEPVKVCSTVYFQAPFLGDSS